jgi:hypothetical protein
MTAEQPALISRTAAHAAGKRFFFTGERCRNGHLDHRYVSTGGCVGCLKKFKPRLHPHNKDKRPLALEHLWVSRRCTPEQLAQLYTYLQQCVDVFEGSVLPPVCTVCNGTQYVPDPERTAQGAWMLCTACS